ncbi:hypothetical protein SESBI_01114 [Sesbania bispinosa]|nr:hypothetical protein SESBI_01114 [Sesbania bispinosa]
MSSSSPTLDLSSDPSSESGNTSSSSFSSLLGDNPPLNINQVPIINIPDSEETESDSEDLSDEGRNIPPPKIYKTFRTETYNNNSEYTSLSAIERFRKSTLIANLTVEPLIVIYPCQKEELICLSNSDQGSSVPFTYMYDTIFCKLNLLLPFSNFEKELLRALNIPPSQLHPNSWAFVRGYQIVCHFYNMTLSMDKFFSFFQVKLPTGDEIGYVSFNRREPPLSSILVSGTEKGSYSQIRPVSFDEKIDVAFLRNQAPIDCGFLLENEDLPARLRQSLDKMSPKTSVPQVITNEKGLRRWLKKAGVDPNAPNSEIQATAPANERRKKQKLDTSRGNQQQQTETGSHPPPQPQACGNTQTQTSGHTSSEPQGSIISIPADRWWYLFNNFKGAEGSDITSIFDHLFPVEQVVGREFNKKEDIARVNKVGMCNVGKHLMTMGMQTSFFGYCFDSALNSVEKEMQDRALKIQELTVKLQAAECSEFETKYSDVVAEQNKQLTASLDALQKEVAILHAQGFHKAIDQMKLLNPGVNVEGVGVFKKIVDGKLVEEYEDDEE